jgi:hypothetical protein
MIPDEALMSFDKHIRFQVYTHFLTAGRAPTMREVAEALRLPLINVQEAYQRLAMGKALVLQEGGEVLMAEPFSAIPTAFVVEVGTRRFWGNCIWDALGIPAMLKQDARVMTACGCCSEAMTLEIRDGQLLNAPGIVHFAIPVKEWWRDVVFT